MKPRPKFAVGEEVRVESSRRPELNQTKTEITARTWGCLKGGKDTGAWLYQAP